MITADTPVFPNNAVELMAIRFATLDADLTVVKRPLRKSDPAQALGVYAALWTPNENSYEMQGGDPAVRQPTISAYSITVEAYIKDMDEERGLATHSVFASLVRAMLYRDAPLLVGLRALSVNVGGSTEQVQRTGIRSQRYSSNELQGSFLYLAVLDYYLETETK